MLVPAHAVGRGDYIRLRNYVERVIEVRPISSSKNAPSMCSWQVEYVALSPHTRQVYIEQDAMVEVIR